MDFRKAVKERRSIRRFIPDDIPDNVIREILEDARWAPSWGNTQPWNLYVVTGEILEKFKETNRKKFLEDEPQIPEIPMPEVWPKHLKTRYMGLGKSVLESLSIAREDKEARRQYYADMYNLFGAPCLILICLDKSLSIEYAMLDVGLIMQTICLLAHERGLGTCMLANSSRYPKLLREWIPIPADQIIVIGMAIGYPDWNSPVNRFERERADLDEIVTWVK